MHTSATLAASRHSANLLRFATHLPFVAVKHFQHFDTLSLVYVLA